MEWYYEQLIMQHIWVFVFFMK